jgi:23S rRNA (guanosine2251-2'-O)-methyltransferase
MKHSFSIVLDDVRSALNVGAIFRTADATGANKLFLSGITPYPPHNRIPKTALGSIETVDWQYHRNKSDIIDILELNYTIISVELTPESILYTDYNFPENSAFIFGNEIAGVSKQYIDKSKITIKIPMFGTKESLNVATSVGIICYEYIRQHS